MSSELIGGGQEILVTGGTGYIGSHTCVALLENGYKPVILDNLCNSHKEVLNRITSITGRRPFFYEGDVRDPDILRAIFAEHPIAATIHFAGLKAVGESVSDPLRYYANNVEGSLILCRELAQAGIKRFIFSSSATVYGNPAVVPIPESASIQPSNPYGQGKAMVECILHDVHMADPGWRMGILRYFNPVGAHESGLIGEDPNGIPNNLMPFITQVAVGRREWLNVFGNDYPTPDGTGVRDYIHVMDLAEGHVAALKRVCAQDGTFTVNLGTGKGCSVLEVVKAFEKASQHTIRYQIRPRRPGDVATCYANPALANQLLNWRPSRGLAEMCADSWRWQQNNRTGYIDSQGAGSELSKG